MLRLPRMRITATDGTTMELNPRPVDMPVTRPLGESAQGRDSQIETAVKELLRADYEIVIWRRKLSASERSVPQADDLRNWLAGFGLP